MTGGDVNTVFDQAATFAASGDYRHAVTLLLKALREKPNDSSILTEIAELSLLQGHKSEAISILRRLAAGFALKGDLLAAIRVNRRILEINPADQETAQALATLTSRSEATPNSDFAAAVQPLLLTPDRSEADSDDGKLISSDELKQIDRAVDYMFEIEFERVRNRQHTQIFADQLPPVPLLSSLTREHLQHLIDKMQLRSFAKGEVVIAEQEEGNELFIIVDGEAEVYKNDGGGNLQFINKLKRGDFFGEIAFFSDSPRSASVLAGDKLSTLVIERGDLAVLTARFPEVAHKLQDYYKSRLIGTVLAISPLFEKLARSERNKLVDLFEMATVPYGQAVIREGEHPDALVVIGTGRVVISTRDQHDRDIVVNTLGPGDFLGEISLISGRAATATCITGRQSTLFRLPRAQFEQLTARFPQMLEVAVETGSARLKRSKDVMQIRDQLIKEGLL